MKELNVRTLKTLYLYDWNIYQANMFWNKNLFSWSWTVTNTNSNSIILNSNNDIKIGSYFKAEEAMLEEIFKNIGSKPNKKFRSYYSKKKNKFIFI